MEKYQFKLITVIYMVFASSSVVSSGKLKKFDVNDDPLVNMENENPRPIVGVMTQELFQSLLEQYPNNNFTSYIAASYVKFVEGAGGRVVPIWIDKPRDYYEDILKKVNGVLLPGGVPFFNVSHGLAEASRHIYEIAIELNDNGTYFPVWGTCWGMEYLVYLSANSIDFRSHCSALAQPLQLEFIEGYEKSRLFRNASLNIIDIFKNYSITANSHKYCFTRETFADMKLNEVWDVMSVNHDWEGTEFISTLEHKIYPFYGTQFHPEKSLYEFVPNRNIPHSPLAIQASQYFADFFINEARRNRQQFDSASEEAESLIYNYAPIHSGLVGLPFDQTYVFETGQSSAQRWMQVNLLTIFLSLLSVFGIYKLIL